MKCVLHNIAEEKIILDILKRIRQSMDNHSMFFLAERLVPSNLLRPHINVQNNILMRVLFKANARTVEFYKSLLQEAELSTDLNLNNELFAKNYLVFKNCPIIVRDEHRLSF